MNWIDSGVRRRKRQAPGLASLAKTPGGSCFRSCFRRSRKLLLAFSGRTGTLNCWSS